VSWDAVALLLGLIVVIGLAALISPLAQQPDPAMAWEARTAIGFTALAFVGPCWLAQGIVTFVASSADGGIRPSWLWVWFAAAPLVGASPPAAALARAFRRALPRRSGPLYSSRGAAAVQQEANFAWAATVAEPGWELRRTPPLPVSWPPSVGGPAVWLCYAERTDTPQTFEVAAPWARITLALGDTAWPVVERLSDGVESLGVQAVQPLSSVGSAKARGSLLDAVYRGDPRARLAIALQDWRTRNGLVAAHSAVAGHLPPD
jgi:hypothetical protein